MYYFEVVELLQNNPGKEYSVMDIYLELSKKRECNLIRLTNVMTKVYLQNTNIDRYKTGRNCYIYYLKH